MTQTPPQSTGKSLFSLHYLATRLSAQPEWQEDAQPAFAALRALWLKAAALGANWNEAQTEDEFVKPVLELLGWHFVVQAKSVKQGRISRPDYALFGDATTRDAAYPRQGDDAAFYGPALAIAEAKYWGRALSKQDAGGRDAWKKDNNPSYQMVAYLVGTRCAWGILTNGQVWRLYSRDVSSTASETYEVDLAAIFTAPQDSAIPTADQLDAFKRWLLFFRRAAFTPDSQGSSFVRRVYEGSATYAKEISDKLKELVFREVMPEIAGGFVAYRRRELGILVEDAASLQQIYQASLSLLYKLLFVLYAEARSLLPVTTPAYREESLTFMAQQFAAKIDQKQVISDATHAPRQYAALLALFRRIDQGDVDLGVPRYDGGLFAASNPDNQFLEQHKLSDRAVARAVDILVRDAGEPVDYAYLTVRNLGSIYEGLLENKLEITSPPASLQGGEGSVAVALVNDKGERKATGSFYTPDYIVAYNVERTLAPILAERAQRFAAAMERSADLRRKLAHADSAGQVATLRPQLDRAEREAREAFLGIKVCDTSMGSAHFLVNTVDFITDAIIEQMQRYHDAHPSVPWEWNPIQQLIEQVRQAIVTEMAQQGIAVDVARLDDTALLTRLVMKRCIYGVDLNPMAVELAKLSLWLHSFTVGAPLSFLDHHLRCGNSLLGADVRTVEAAIQQTASGQFGLFAGPFAGLLDLTGVMIQIAEQTDATLADVRRSAQHFADFQAALTPYKQVLDLWVSQHFGNKGAGEFLTLYGGEVLPALRGERAVGEPHRAAIDRARELWQAQRFFHWDLEFPEVFIDLARRDWAEQPGFDAMVGNPPYVRQEQLAPIKPYLQTAFQVYHGVADLYAYFYELDVRLLRQGGWLSLITSNKFLRASYGEPLRRFLAGATQLQEMIDFGHAPIFEDADTFPIILVLRRPSPETAATEPQADVCTFPREALGRVELASYVAEHSFAVATARFGAAPWSLERPDVDALMDKLRCNGVPLGEYVGSKPVYGIKTGLNEAFLIDTAARNRLIAEDPACADLIRPYLRGQDIKRWAPAWADLWMIVLKSSENHVWPWSAAGVEAETMFAQRFPSLYHHVKPQETAMRKRQDQGRYWWELRSCTYYEVFEQPKLLYQEIQFHPAFGYDDAGYLTNNKGFLLASSDLYLLAVLNSPLMWWHNWRYLPHMKDEALSPKGELMELLPVAPAPDAIRAEVEPAVQRLLALTHAHRQASASVLDWLRVEFDVAAPSQRLEALAALDRDEFVREVTQRRPRPAGRLSPASVQALFRIYDEHVPALRVNAAEAGRLERRLAELINQVYQLTPAEVDLLWRTAPPRMPVVR